MATPAAAPIEALDAVRACEARLVATIVASDDATMARPPLLPGWTVAHLLTHVARNADGHVRWTRAAIDDVVVDGYPDGPAWLFGRHEREDLPALDPWP